MKPLTTTVILFSILSSINALNILAIFPYHGKSHFLVYKHHINELVNRGHNVTVISPFPEKNPPKNYHDISLADSLEVIADDIPLDRSLMSLLGIVYFITTAGNQCCEKIMASKQVQKLIEDKPKFDVVLFEQFNTDCALAIAYKLNAPAVATQSFVLMPWHFPRSGIPYNPSYVPFHFGDGGTKATFLQKVEHTVLNTLINGWYFYVTQRNDEKTLAKYFDDIPPLEELAKEIKILLVYSNFAMGGPRLFPSNVIEVGGYHVAKAKPLTGNIKKFVDEAEHGVIYISFGSLVKTSSMPDDKRDAILEAMKEFPQRFIWKWEDTALLVDKNKLYIDSWLPQVDILGHSKTVAFFSHGGMGGATEGVYFGVPMIVMPIVGDQPSNAAAIEESGLGIILHVKDLNKDNLVAAFKKVLEPKFRQNVKEISAAWHDRPQSAIDTAVFWTEFVARHPTLSYRSPIVDVPLYQYLCLDLLVLVFVVILIILFAVKALCCKSKKKTSSKNKSKRE